MRTIALSLVVLAVVFSQAAAYRKVCYFASWAVYRQGPGHYEPELLDANLCTHLIYTFVGVSEDGDIQLLDAWNDIGDEWHEGLIQRMNKLKTQNPNLKTMIAAGGWNFGTRVFSIVANDPAKRQRFANSAAEFLIKYGYDGFDIDWEYPAVGPNSQPTDREALTEMLKVFRQRFDQSGLLLSMATSSSIASVAISYDLPALSTYLDFVNVMAYDLHGSWETNTGHVAPVYYGSYLDNFPDADKTLYCDAIINNFIAKGSNPQKINLGMVAYARTFTLADPNQNGMGAPTTGPGQAGTYYAEPGSLGYHELCHEQTQGLWTDHWDDQQQVPYSVKGNQWAGYDDTRSIKAKTDLIKKYNLGGGMIWSIESDDFAGACNLGKYPLLKKMNDELA